MASDTAQNGVHVPSAPRLLRDGRVLCARDGPTVQRGHHIDPESATDPEAGARRPHGRSNRHDGAPLPRPPRTQPESIVYAQVSPVCRDGERHRFGGVPATLPATVVLCDVFSTETE